MPKWKTIFSIRESDGKYKIEYDPELDEGRQGHKLAGAIYFIMRKFPELIEDILLASITSAEELTKPFEDILNDNNK